MTYTYECKTCKKYFDIDASSLNHDKKCPLCGNDGERVFKSIPFIAKCEGFCGKTKVKTK